jgi:hypothetical protein
MGIILRREIFQKKSLIHDSYLIDFAEQIIPEASLGMLVDFL